jgi:hypothetical protein
MREVVFGESAGDQQLPRAFGVGVACERHHYMARRTKNAERFREFRF